MDSTRVDRWLWSIRLYRTRSDASAACRGGHVRVNDRPAKAATPVRVGDRVAARAGGRQRDVEVLRLIEKRVGAPEAAACFDDHSPLVLKDGEADASAVRSSPGGRPTKRDRRRLDRFRLG